MTHPTKDTPPFALTDQHVAALERAIRAKGYDILIDSASGDIQLRAVEGGSRDSLTPLDGPSTIAAVTDGCCHVCGERLHHGCCNPTLHEEQKNALVVGK